jgi:hypothetical protein
MCRIASKTIIIIAHLETLCLKVNQYFSWVNFNKTCLVLRQKSR